MNLETQLDPAAIQAMLAAALLMILTAVKQTPLPRWLLPFVAFLLGGAGYCLLTGWSPLGFLYGLVAGGGAVGLHQAGKHASERDGGSGTPDKTPTLPMALMAGLCLVLVLGAGCGSTGSKSSPGDVPGVTPLSPVEKHSQLVRVAAMNTTFFVVRNNPDLREDFALAAESITQMASNDVTHPVKVDETLNLLVQEGVIDPEVLIVLKSGLGLYNAYYVDYAHTNPIEFAVPVLTALAEGVKEGLAAVPVEEGRTTDERGWTRIGEKGGRTTDGRGWTRMGKAEIWNTKRTKKAEPRMNADERAIANSR